VVRLEQVLVVVQTPDGQLAPAGQASTGVQVQALAPNPVPVLTEARAQLASVVIAEHGSLTATAGICCEPNCVFGDGSDCD